MRKILLGYLLSLAILPDKAKAQEVCLQTNFNNGIPENFTLICYDQMPVKTQDFKNTVPQKTWFTGQAYGADGNVAMSTSHRYYDMPTDNWMITPKISISSEKIWLAWDARAIHYDFRDGYKIMISTTDTQAESFEELLNVEEETYIWNHHLISLQAYEGKDVYIAFVHNSQNKFLLAIDNLYIGEYGAVGLEAHNDTKHFCGNVGTEPVNGRIRNIGKDVRLQKITCTVNNKEMPFTGIPEGVFSTGEEINFSFEVPVTSGKNSVYKIEAATKDGEEFLLLEDSIICSYYPRTLLVEKLTGAWCTSCPTMIPYINELRERYKDELVCIEAHYNDPGLTYLPYIEGLQTYNFPTAYYNRATSYPQYAPNEKPPLLRALGTPTIALVSDLTASFNEEGRIDVSAKMAFAEDTDNTSGKYRIGFTIMEKTVQSTDSTLQRNGVATLLSFQEYYHLSTRVAKDLMVYHNVARGTSSTFIGIKGSLPEQIESGREYLYEGTLDIPETVFDKENIAVVAFVMNSFANDVLNSAETKVAGTSTNIGKANSIPALQATVNLLPGGNCRVTFPQDRPFQIQLYTPDGKSVGTIQGTGTSVTLQTGQMGKGCYILRLQQENTTSTKKIIL